jgi:serine O-acetyltransferase
MPAVAGRETRPATVKPPQRAGTHMFENLGSDLSRKRRHYVRIDNFVNKYLKITFQLGTLAVVVYRLGAWCMSRPLGFLLRPVYWVLKQLSVWLTGVDVDPRTPIGRGFVIHNFSTIIIQAAAVGENFTVNQGVSVGPDWRANGLPRIGNNVFLGSGAKVLGNIELGNNVVVAANALVERPVPDNCTVVGVPARVISRDAGSDYLRFDSGHKPPQTA